MGQHDISDLSARLRDGFRMIDALCDQLEDLVNVNDGASNTTMHEYVSGSGPSQQMQSKQRQDSVGLIQKQKQKQMLSVDEAAGALEGNSLGTGYAADFIVHPMLLLALLLLLLLLLLISSDREAYML